MNRKITSKIANCSRSPSFVGSFVYSFCSNREEVARNTGSTSVHVFDFNSIDLLFISNKINYFHFSSVKNLKFECKRTNEQKNAEKSIQHFITYLLTKQNRISSIEFFFFYLIHILFRFLCSLSTSDCRPT